VYDCSFFFDAYHEWPKKKEIIIVPYIITKENDSKLQHFMREIDGTDFQNDFDKWSAHAAGN
jgi:hypothetical protein